MNLQDGGREASVSFGAYRKVTLHVFTAISREEPILKSSTRLPPRWLPSTLFK